MSDKHTPNPLPCGCRVEGEPERAGWRIRRYVRHCDLHAAAPCLLAACELMLADVAAYLERGGTLTPKEAAHVSQMRAAVKKAKGD